MVIGKSPPTGIWVSLNMATKNKKPLQHIHVIVTRPQQQGIFLCASLERLGAKVMTLPSFAIEGVTLPPEILKKWLPFQKNDIVLFLSANAVHYSEALWSWMSALPACFAIGSGTANALQAAQLPLTGIPENYCSEGLLALDALQHVKNRRVFICSGAQSRPLLAETLRNRGAQVIPLVCYRRYRPLPEKTTLQQLNPDAQTVSITTSKEGLSNFHTTLTHNTLHWLLNRPLLVAHPSHEELATQLGFMQVLINQNPSDADILKRLIRFVSTGE